MGVSDDPNVRELRRFYFQEGRWGDHYRSALEGKIDSKLTEIVSLVGNVPHGEVAAYYRAADVVVSPSLSEAFGMSLVEAMASERVFSPDMARALDEALSHPDIKYNSKFYSYLKYPMKSPMAFDSLLKTVTIRSNFKSLFDLYIFISRFS